MKGRGLLSPPRRYTALPDVRPWPQGSVARRGLGRSAA